MYPFRIFKNLTKLHVTIKLYHYKFGENMRFLTIYLVLFIFWIIWSGKFDLFHLALGVVSTYLVTKGSGDLFFDKKKAFSLPVLFKKWLRF